MICCNCFTNLQMQMCFKSKISNYRRIFRNVASFNVNVMMIGVFADSGEFFPHSYGTFLIPDSYAYYLFIIFYRQGYFVVY